MAEKTPKALAMLLMAKNHPDMTPSPDEADDSDPSMSGEGPEAPVDQNLADAAHDIITAIKMDNENSLASALQDFVDMCGTGGASGAAESTAADESPAEGEVEGG